MLFNIKYQIVTYVLKEGIIVFFSPENGGNSVRRNIRNHLSESFPSGRYKS